jgi:hypothetical protein
MKEGVAREKFKRLVVERFDFLKLEFGCTRTIRSEGAEYAPTYRNEDVEVVLSFAYPELPLLELEWNDGKAVREFRYAPSKTGTEGALRRRYYRLVEATPKNRTPGSEETFEIAAQVLDLQVGSLRGALANIEKKKPPRGAWVAGSVRKDSRGNGSRKD